MVKKIVGALFALLLFFPGTSALASSIFWQPQERDLVIDNQEWVGLMQQLQGKGVTHVVVQWTRYGDSFSSENQISELREKLLIATREGLGIVLGLYLDPEFYSLQKQPRSALHNYLKKQRHLDVQQALLWQKLLGDVIEGWYISSEIDDENWRDSSQQEVLLHWLLETSLELEKIADIPLYISSFFTGKMVPRSYEQLLVSIRNIGYRVWVQDGAGVAALTDSQRKVYLDQVVDCGQGLNKPADGVIYELFELESESPFRAVSKPLEAIEALMEYPQQDCSATILFFSLRYLPISKPVFSTK